MLVQTIAPEARAIVLAAAHDSDGFLAGELDRRRALGYPPFSNLIRIVCSAREPDARAAPGAARRARARLVRASAPRAGTRARARDAVPPARARAPDARGQGRLAPPRGARRRRGRAGVADGRAHAGVNFSVDVDPQ